jgi:hypothetical protein
VPPPDRLIGHRRGCFIQIARQHGQFEQDGIRNARSPVVGAPAGKTLAQRGSKKFLTIAAGEPRALKSRRWPHPFEARRFPAGARTDGPRARIARTRRIDARRD